MDSTTLESVLTVLAGGMADIREELNKLNRTLERWESLAEDRPKSVSEINKNIKNFFGERKQE
tara:strand:+ start:380 stop:568 length:189 start_codon:yes stop_codon:yes gene_type:complete